MSGIMAALKANHSLSMVCEPIYYFALTLIAPLSADDHYVFSHVY
jgi:hypothetical protein